MMCLGVVYSVWDSQFLRFVDSYFSTNLKKLAIVSSNIFFLFQNWDSDCRHTGLPDTVASPFYFLLLFFPSLSELHARQSLLTCLQTPFSCGAHSALNLLITYFRY